ncbi:uncharacterized protein V6R79_004058 [Siganus canaliculatus]
MFLYMLVFMAYHSSRWIPRTQRLKFQIVNAVFTVLVLVPQLYILASRFSFQHRFFRGERRNLADQQVNCAGSE